MLGVVSPPAIRSSVDLPDPERPSRPTISPDCSDRSIPSNTGSALGVRPAKVLPTPSSSITGVLFADALTDGSLQSSAAFGKRIQRTPQQTIHGDDKERHD